VPTPHYNGQAALGFLFLAAAVAIAGLPPLSGFIGKLLILEATLTAPYWGAIWAMVLTTSLLALITFARIGSTLFWKSDATPPIAANRAGPHYREALPALFLLTLLVALTVGAGPATGYMEATGAQVFEPGGYIEAVLGPATNGAAR
jgi:multicomponent K+:H+ antiporter subunit D